MFFLKVNSSIDGRVDHAEGTNDLQIPVWRASFKTGLARRQELDSPMLYDLVLIIVFFLSLILPPDATRAEEIHAGPSLGNLLRPGSVLDHAV